jgi:hypothetical protein
VIRRPSPGLMCTHNNTPIEFLHLISDVYGVEEWLVRPLFVVGVNRTVFFRPGDRLTPLHSTSR